MLAKYGAFINILPGRDGLMHISKFHSEIRVGDPEKVLTVGDKIQVVVDSIENGKVGLTPVNDIEIPEDAIEKRQSGKRDRNQDLQSLVKTMMVIRKEREFLSKTNLRRVFNYLRFAVSFVGFVDSL